MESELCCDLNLKRCFLTVIILVTEPVYQIKFAYCVRSFDEILKFPIA